MIWGVGTGRCGTKSLAQQLGGVHEPQPWLIDQPARYIRGEVEGEEIEKLKRMLTDRRDMQVGAVVDLKQSWVMDLIEEVDPSAQFFFVARNPVMCVASFLSGGSWTESDYHGTRKMAPGGGWPEGWSRERKATWYWESTNKAIADHIERTRRPWEMRFTDELTPRCNTHVKSPGWPFEREVAAMIFDETWETWARLQKIRRASK